MAELSLFFQNGDVIEIRALGKQKGAVQSGYYKDFKKMEETINILDKTGEHKGIYFTLNKVNPALYARRPDALSTPREALATTSDADIERRRWLPVDFDPKRPSEISSTNEEHDAAIERAKEVREYLRSMHWPEPILADSGNGAHLLYKIDLPNNESATENVSLCLKALDAIFSDDKVDVDTANFNAARIWKAYGTTTRKGGNIPERPWRRSQILETPAELIAVPEEMLASLGWGFKQKEREEKYEPQSKKTDLEQWLSSHGIDVVKCKPAKNGGTMYIIDTCPWNSSHVDRSAWAVQFPSGAIAAGCKHNGCSGRGWRDLRALYEPQHKKEHKEESTPTDSKKKERLPEISIADVTDEKTITRGPNEGEVEYHFNPDKAADAIINSCDIVSTPDEKIWIYKDGFYKNDGKFYVDSVLDRVAGSLYTINASRETIKKILLRTTEDFTIFDSNPYLLCVRNGTIDLLTGTRLDHSPKYYLTSACPVNYDPAAMATEFIKFLENSCQNDSDRLTLIDWMVACAVHAEFEYILFLTGHGSNGKRIYEELLQAFFGSDTTEAIALEELMNSKFAMGYLQRARICISSETNPDKTKTELIKKISGNDWLSCDVKNKDRIRFKAYTQLIFDSNSMPVFEDTSYGFTRRFTSVTMPFTFCDLPDEKDPLQKKADRHLAAKLATDQELSGILNLMIARAKVIGLDRIIHRRGDDFARYEMQSYSVSDFIERFIEFNAEYKFNNEYQEPGDFLFGKFEEFAKYTIGAKVSRKKFSILLGRENGEASRTVRAARVTMDDKTTVPVRGFRGLKFDDLTFNDFISKKKEEYLHCNDINRSCNDLKNNIVTDTVDGIVTTVTMFRQLLNSMEYDISYISSKCEGVGDTSLQEKSPSVDALCNDVLESETSDVLLRALGVMRHLKNPVTPEVLAIRAETLDTIISKDACQAWLISQGWKEDIPSWRAPAEAQDKPTVGKIDRPTPTEKQSTCNRIIERIRKTGKPVTNFAVRDAMRNAGYDLDGKEIESLMLAARP